MARRRRVKVKAKASVKVKHHKGNKMVKKIVNSRINSK